MAMLMAALHGDLPGQRVLSLGAKLANIGAPKSAGQDQGGGQDQGSNPNLSLAQFGNVLKGGGGEAAAGEAGGAVAAGEAAGGAAEGLGSLAALAAL